MTMPESLDTWTYDTVVAVVVKHEYEPGRFDYKDVLSATRQDRGDHVASIRRTTCSMANGDGGYILFGVKDPAVEAAMPTDRIVGIPRASDLRKVFGEKLATIERDVYFDAKAIDLPADTARCVFVVHIPTSNLRPHIDNSDGRFLIRGEGGSARPMSYFEVRDQMLYTEGRLQKVTLLRLELATFRQVNDMLNHPETWTVRFDTGSFKVLLAEISDLLQPDPGLLALLHGIGRDATLLNPLLDRQEALREVRSDALLPGGQTKYQVVREIPEKRAQLFNRCADAEARLTTLFGPLATS